MFAIGGGNVPHGIIASALAVAVGKRLDGKSCRTISSDVRIQVTSTGFYTYPDLAVLCLPPLVADRNSDILLNPVVIAEVLSPSTEIVRQGQEIRTLPYDSIFEALHPGFAEHDAS